MNYSAIDYHKKNSFISTLNEKGERVAEAKIIGNDPALFAQYFSRLGEEEPSKVVLELGLAARCLERVGDGGGSGLVPSV
jgi:hypothetical protein